VTDRHAAAGSNRFDQLCHRGVQSDKGNTVGRRVDFRRIRAPGRSKLPALEQLPATTSLDRIESIDIVGWER
jgi:hypothetical protein